MYERAALELATEVDIEGVEACPLCLWELAWAIHRREKPSRALVARTVEWVWLEIEDSIQEAVVRARMEERPFAEEVLRELKLNGWRSGFAEAVVWRLAREFANEMAT